MRPKIDRQENLVEVLLAISVVSARLAHSLSAVKVQKGENYHARFNRNNRQTACCCCRY